jgi:hypothetical protein
MKGCFKRVNLASSPLVLERFFLKLSKVTKCEILVHDLFTQKIWQGDGEVAVSHQLPFLLFQEKGQWRSGITFYNQLCFSISQGNSLLLEELRQGKSHKRRLFFYKYISDNQLQAKAPFLCGRDCYQSQIAIKKGLLELHTQVSGGKKNLKIKVVYR